MTSFTEEERERVHELLDELAEIAERAIERGEA